MSWVWCRNWTNLYLHFYGIAMNFSDKIKILSGFLVFFCIGEIIDGSVCFTCFYGLGVQSYNKECIVDGFRFLSHHESRETSERQKAKIPSEKFTGNVVSIGTWDDAFRIKGSIDKNSSKNVQWHLYVFRGVKWISRRKKNKKKCYWYRSLCHVELLILTWHPKTKNQRRKNTHRQTKNAWRSWRASEKHRERETNERKQKTIHEK